MLTTIGIRNFKAFEKQTIDIKPITLFLGPNNSGKSSILSSLRILSQTAQSYDPTIPLLLNGELGDFGTYSDVIYSNNKRRHLGLKVGICTGESGIDRHYFGKKKININLDLNFHYRTKRKEIVLNKMSLFADDDLVLGTKYIEDSEIHRLTHLQHVPDNLIHKISKKARLDFDNFIPTVRSRHILNRAIEEMTKNNDLSIESDVINTTLRRSTYISYKIRRVFDAIEYVGAMRQPPSRTYLYTGENRKHVGNSGQYAINLLAMDSLRGGSKSKNILLKVKDWLTKSEIASDIRIDSISDRHFEVKLQHPETKEYQNYADVGYGNSQVIPVLVAGYNLPENSTFITEEPEIHLHPKAQAELGDFFLDLYSNNVQSLVETHSEHLILRLQQHIASGLIDHNEIAIYYVYPDKGKKSLSLLELNSKGEFIEEWPNGFFPERLNEAKKL